MITKLFRINSAMGVTMKLLSSVVARTKPFQVQLMRGISIINRRAVKMIQILWNSGNNSITTCSVSILSTQLVHPHLSKLQLALHLRIPILLDLTLSILKPSTKLQLLGRHHRLISLTLRRSSSYRRHSSISRTTHRLLHLPRNMRTKHI